METAETKKRGLSNFQIRDIAASQGIPLDAVLPEDKIPEIAKIIRERGGKHLHSFIINTAPRGAGEGEQFHWYAVIFNTEPEKETVEIFNSLGADNREGLIEDKLRQFINDKSAEIFPEGFPVLKVNAIKVQGDDLTNCGFFALNFLKDRLVHGKSFKDATGFNKYDKNKRKLIRGANPFEVVV